MASYDRGDPVRLTATFTNITGATIDPTTVTIQYRPPLGTQVTKIYLVDPEVVKDSTGVYHIDIALVYSGLWTYRWFSTGTGQAAARGQLEVVPSNA
mgnify:CR=1 FL=1